MPYIEFKTNMPLTHEKEDILKSKIADVLASSFPGKTENWLMVRFARLSEMYFGGTEDKCMMIDVAIFGKQEKAGYDKMTAETCKLIESECGLPADRIYIKYSEYDKWGWNGQNF